MNKTKEPVMNSENQKLKDWTYIRQASWVNKGTEKHLNKTIVKEYSEFDCRKRIQQETGELLSDDSDAGWSRYLKRLHQTTFTQQNIYTFVELEDGTLVGLNESPSHGWSFPTAKWKD